MERDTVPHSLFAVIASGSGLALEQPLSLRYQRSGLALVQPLSRRYQRSGLASVQPLRHLRWRLMPPPLVGEALA